MEAQDAYLYMECDCEAVTEKDEEREEETDDDDDDGDDGETTKPTFVRFLENLGCAYYSAGIMTQAWVKRGFMPVLQVVTKKDDFQEYGYFVLSKSVTDEALIVKYFEDSFYSSKHGILWNGEEDDKNALWHGTMDELFEIAELRRDLIIPSRIINPKDYDYGALNDMYRGILAWKAQGCPMWSGRARGEERWKLFVRVRDPYYSPTKTPLARVVAEEWDARNVAAAKIQAWFRAWQWRLKVLYNPNTEIGKAYLLRKFALQMACDEG